MKITRCGEAPFTQAPADKFVGTVWMDPMVDADAPARVHAASVTFMPGARTNWHWHPLGQTLRVISGLGWFQTEGQERVEIRPGDTIWIPPHEKHWHGATDTTMMTHIAIQEKGEEGQSVWLEPVSDEDYLATR
jgi:quercetin dioxygenase-like cupin family protein